MNTFLNLLKKYRFIFLVAGLGCLLLISGSTPAVADLGGSHVHFVPSAGTNGASCYIPNRTQTLCFNLETLTSDGEDPAGVVMKFPDDWNVPQYGTETVSQTCFNGGTFGSLTQSDWPTGRYVVDGRAQNAPDHCTAVYCWSVSAGATTTNDVSVPWIWIDNMSGTSPHSPCSNDDYFLDYPLLGCDEHDANPPASVPVCTYEALTILPETLTNGTAVTYYSQEFTASDAEGNVLGYDQVSWSWISQDIPVNCSLWSDTGEFECYSFYNEIPLSAGTYHFTVSVYGNEGWADGSRDYTWIVDPLLEFDPDELLPGRLTQAYSQTITVSGGASPYTLTLASGTLPVGITFDEETDSFTGTPTEIGTFPDIVIQAVDANGITNTITYSLTVLPEHLFTWAPTEPLEGQSAIFTAISGYDEYYWTRGYDPGDSCEIESYYVGYGSPITIPFNGGGQYQVCLRIWEPTIYDYIYDSQWVTVPNGPPTYIYINAYPQPSLVGETIYPYAYIDDYSNGPFTCTVSWGDGSPVESVTTVLGARYCDLPPHTYGTIGSFTIGVTASEEGVVGSITGTITHDVVYYFGEGYDTWLTSNIDPTTIELVTYATAGYTELGFNIATLPEYGSLGDPTFVSCDPAEGEGPLGLMINQTGYQIERFSDQGLEGIEITADQKAALSAEIAQEASDRMMCRATVVYTPTVTDPLLVGYDGFTFSVNDGVNGDSNVASVQLWVDANSAPTALDGSSTARDAGSTLLILTATDPDEYEYSTDRITFIIDSGPFSGSLGIPSSASCETMCDEYTCSVVCTAVVAYTPNPGATTDSFTFHVNDSHYDSNIATVLVEVHAPATLHVNALDDFDDGVCDGTHCNLREAVNAALIGDTIDFTIDPASLPATITLVNGQILIGKALTITGPGADLIAISGGALLSDEVDGSHDRVFEVYDWETYGMRPVTATLSGLTIRDGRSGEGGGIIMGPGSIVTLNDCVIGPNNIVTYAGGGIASEGGTLTLNRCTVADNHGTGSMGGAGILSYYSTTTLINSTVTGNITNNYGGGIYAVNGGTVNLIHSTVSGNTANQNYELEPWGGGGGIFISDATVTIQNSIVAGNVDLSLDHTPSDDVIGAFTSLGGNLIGDGTGSSGWVSGDLVGTEAAPIDPMLDSLTVDVPDVPDLPEDPLTYTLTYVFALLDGSPAIDAAPTCEVFEDQRGVGRPQGNACDIGAYELEQITATGSLKITKVFDPLTSGYVGTFVVRYDCDGDIFGFIDLGAGDTTTINDIPAGYQCTVSEIGIPTPPPGWSFGAPTFSPSATVTISETLAEVVVTNTIIQDVPQTGELVISKTFDALTSGFTDTFAIDYDCDDGTDHDGTVNLLAAGSETISGLPLGTVCTVTEATLPTPPIGWSFGLPTFAPETGAVTITEASPAYAEVVVTNTISRDTGSLMITKYFDPLTSGFASTFAINYDCDDGETHDGTVNLAAGASDTITDIPTGTICTISEPTLPDAPAGWSFGEPVLSPADGIVTVVIGTQGSSEILAPAEAWVSVTNTISRDLGELKISKVFDPLTSGFIGDFTITYDCDDDPAHDGTVYLAAGEFETITGIPTGTTCHVSEGELPVAPAGWSFNGPTYLPINGTAIISLVPSEVVVTNTIVEDVAATGELKISKVFDPLTSGFTGNFALFYDCGGENWAYFSLAAGESQTFSSIPIGSNCSVSEATLPSAPEGWFFRAPILSPASGSVTISEASPAYAEVVVTNSIMDVRSQVTTTRTKCSAFAANLAPDLDRLVVTTAYNRKTGATYIKKITPSAFYYYAKAFIPAEASVIIISNVTDPFGYPNVLPTTTLYDENCVPLAQSMATITTGPGNSVRIEFPAAASERIVYIGVSYATKPLVGYVIDLPFSGFTYTFKTALDGAIFTQDDLLVNYGINLSKIELP